LYQLGIDIKILRFISAEQQYRFKLKFQLCRQFSFSVAHATWKVEISTCIHEHVIQVDNLLFHAAQDGKKNSANAQTCHCLCMARHHGVEVDNLPNSTSTPRWRWSWIRLFVEVDFLSPATICDIHIFSSSAASVFSKFGSVQQGVEVDKQSSATFCRLRLRRQCGRHFTTTYMKWKEHHLPGAKVVPPAANKHSHLYILHYKLTHYQPPCFVSGVQLRR